MRIPFHSLVLSPLLLLAACGGSESATGSGGSGGSGGGDGGSPTAACVASEATQSVELNELSASSDTMRARWYMVGVLERPEGASLLLQSSVKGGAKVFAFLGPDGKIAEVARIAGASDHTCLAGPVSMPGGKRCAVYTCGNETLKLGCDDGTTEDSKLEDVGESSFGNFLPVAYADGSILIYTTTHASYTVLVRFPDGQWLEDEQFVSSISWTEDVSLQANGHPVACYISPGGRAVITAGEASIRSKEEAKTCKIVVDGSTIHVVLDKGVAMVPLSSLSEQDGATYEIKPLVVKPEAISGSVLTLAAVGGSRAFGVTMDPVAKKLQRVALDSGTITALGDAPDDDFSYRARFNAATGTLTVASLPPLDYSAGDPTSQSFRIAKYCTAEW